MLGLADELEDVMNAWLLLIRTLDVAKNNLLPFTKRFGSDEKCLIFEFMRIGDRNKIDTVRGWFVFAS